MCVLSLAGNALFAPYRSLAVFKKKLCEHTVRELCFFSGPRLTHKSRVIRGAFHVGRARQLRYENRHSLASYLCHEAIRVRKRELAMRCSKQLYRA